MNVDPISIGLTAIYVAIGLFLFLRGPFGVSFSYENFASIREKIFATLALTIFSLFWPVWVPIGSFFLVRKRVRVRKAKPVYLEFLASSEQLQLAIAEVEEKISTSITNFTANPDRPTQTDKLRSLISQYQVLTEDRLHPVQTKLRDLYYEFFVGSLDEEIGPEPPTSWELLGAKFLDEGSPLKTFSFTPEHNNPIAYGLNILRSRLEPTKSFKIDPTFTVANESRKDTGLRYSIRFPEGPTWKIIFEKQCEKSLKKVDKPIFERAVDAIEDIGIDPMTPRGNTISRLSDNKQGLWRYRIGDYRLLYLPIPDQRQIVLLNFEHRSKVYK